ncbi:MAG TPA: hypothetical protein VFU69_05165, partial [Ktedonobacterales bacterium]|nr:hypothetical protein [Ktedonobacterales bacterium]
ELDDFLETEVGVAVAATAALFSPRVRKALRQGAVYGVAGALMAGDAISGFARGVGRGAQQVAASTNGAGAPAAEGAEAAQATPSRRAARKGEETSPQTRSSLHGTTTDGMSPGAASSTAASISGGQATTNPANGSTSGRKGREKPTHE